MNHGKKLAVFFPGIGYTTDKPLMYYSRRLAGLYGYEIRLLPYSGFPSKIRGNKEMMKESFRIALEQSREMLADIDLPSYEDILFIGKSIGTAVAARIASESPAADRIRLVLYTPLVETFSFSFGKAVVFTGTDDPWVGKTDSPVPSLCAKRKIPCYRIAGGNHSLEGADLLEDIANMQNIMKITKEFISEYVPRPIME